MRSKSFKWSVGGAAFLLPALVGVMADFLERMPSINSAESMNLLLILFGGSVICAAVIPAVFTLSASITLVRRLGFTVLLWCFLFLEVYIVILWSLRGIH
jgi:hypothetical protein